jgi:hypothetical protein
MRQLAEADLNHDGMPDLVFELRVKWNRGPGMVREAAVYISDRRSDDVLLRSPRQPDDRRSWR